MPLVSFHPYAYRMLSASTPTLHGHFRVPFAGFRKESESRPSSAQGYDSPTPRISDPSRPSDETKVSPPLVPRFDHPYVQHGCGATLLLTGHKAETSIGIPIFSSGSLISGTVYLNKPPSVASLEIKVRPPPLSLYQLATDRIHHHHSWKALSPYAKSREGAEVTPSFSLINYLHGTPQAPTCLTSSPFVVSCLLSPTTGAYSPQPSTAA
jgi:hypothetical protein